MRTRHDQLAAGVLGKALETIGQVDPEPTPIPGLEATELWFEPDLARANRTARARLGVLGRMTRSSCLIEPFHCTPPLGRIRESLGKQLALDRSRVQSSTRGRARYRTPLPLWLISTGRPRTLLRSPTMKPMRGWPMGFWRAEIPIEAMRVIVLADLPANRDTLLLRLLGRGVTFARAVRQLVALGSRDWSWRLASPQLVAFRMQHRDNPTDDDKDDDDMADILRQLDEVYARWERETLQRGAEQGRTEALREVLEAQLQRRFGQLPGELRARLHEANADALARWLERAPDAESAEAALGH